MLATAAGQRDPQLARVACDARYSAPCARTNSEFLAWDTARSFTTQLTAGTSSDGVLAQITAGAFNINAGFYPFVFDAGSSELLAHGERDDLVGKSVTASSMSGSSMPRTTGSLQLPSAGITARRAFTTLRRGSWAKHASTW